MAAQRHARRLPAQTTEIIDRTCPVAFEFDGASVEALDGDTIASALAAAGRSTFSRSFKYHRPRGLLCVSGRCPNCLVTVDGVPNVRACTRQVTAGMEVRAQNAWPSLDRDFLAVLDKLDWLMPVGFYYKAFHRPDVLWRLAQPIIRRIAGLGVLETEQVPESPYTHRSLHTDVAVVGGGPAGLSAALTAAESGATVILIDDQPGLGGSLRYDTSVYDSAPGFDRPVSGFEMARHMVETVAAVERIEVMSNAVAFGLYQDNQLGVLSARQLIKIRARQTIVASGSYEVPLVFAGNDLPGVILVTAAQRLVGLYGVAPGARAVVATSADQGYAAALDLMDAGVRVATVTDTRPGEPRPREAAEALKARGVPVLTGHAVTRAEGSTRVTAALVRRLDGGTTEEERRFECDVLCMSGGFQPANSLLYQAGVDIGHDPSLGEAVPREMPPNIHVAGEVTGYHDLPLSLLQGRLAGADAAEALGRVAPERGVRPRREIERLEASYRNEVAIADLGETPPGEGKKLVCFCEDVTAADIGDAVDEGFGDIQTLKRYTTCTMGPCQGKMCLKSFTALAARHTGRTVEEMGVTTSRPPLEPVPLAALAGLPHMPVMRTPMDRKHQDLGASVVDLGPWRRAYSYGSPQDECLAVRERVGLIDVSTLGKLDVRGADAPALLDKVYTHRFSDLRVGRIRYGVLCSDNGSIIDDGTVTRLAEDHYFVTTTTGNIALIEEWFKWWMAGTDMCAHVTNVTGAYGAINVAGPRARDTLSKLSDIDFSSDAFRYMRSSQDLVAGVPTVLLRIGFVGEAGWELHFPAEYGEYMWDTLMDAGREFGIAPFGLEAQRILRLEKKHVIVGQDTDSVSNPLDTDMEWVVRFDKEDFIGRGGLAVARDRGPRNKLVGFVMRDQTVPDDGDPVVRDGYPIGRVTSSRLSPTLDRGFGMAWVPIEQAEEGQEIWIRLNGRDHPADIRMEPFYDPEGKRLRE